MKCKQAQRALSRYLDRELSSTEMASVGEHLEHCPECRAEHARQQRLWDLLGRAEPVGSPDLTAAIEARLAQPRGWSALLAGLRLDSFVPAAAAAAVVAGFVWMGSWAGATHGAADAETHDRAFGELLSDAPPGMEAVAWLELIGERR